MYVTLYESQTDICACASQYDYLSLPLCIYLCSLTGYLMNFGTFELFDDTAWLTDHIISYLYIAMHIHIHNISDTCTCGAHTALKLVT